MTSSKLNWLKLTILAIAFGQHPIANAGFFDDLKNKVDNALDIGSLRLKFYSRVADKPLVDAFYFISADGKEQSVSKDLLALRSAYRVEKVAPEVLTLSDLLYKGGMDDVVRTMSVYAASPLDDFGKRYVEFANSRGNQVRQYKPELTGILNSMLVQNLRYMPGPNVRTWLAKDNALIEVDPKGELVSVMTRSHRAIDIGNATSDMYINIYMGKELMRLLENKIANRVFDENFQRVVALDSPQPLAVDPKASPDQTVASPQPAPTQTPGAASASAAVPAVAPAQEVAPAAAASKQPMSSQKKMQLLQELAELKKSGALTAEEFEAEKRKILAQ